MFSSFYNKILISSFRAKIINYIDINNIKILMVLLIFNNIMILLL